tara:strand:+ start:358 stop:543 length:186 start_codon:yes stop_codon:yes gene_type:complete
MYKVPGLNWEALYNMPIWLRSFYLKEYREWRKAENENAGPSSEEAQDQAYQQYKNMHQNPS